MAEIERKCLKLAMLGDSSVGKTSICYSLINLEFDSNILSTIGQEKIESKMEMEDGKEMKLIIWDTAGQERFHSMALNACRKAQGIVVVFDVGKKQTFENVGKWLNEIKEHFNDPAIVLFGNKCDLPKEEREITKEEAENFAAEKNLTYFETSAKTKKNINEGFKKIANEAYKKTPDYKPGIVLEPIKEKKKGGCCGGGEKEEKKEKKEKKGKKKK